MARETEPLAAREVSSSPSLPFGRGADAKEAYAPQFVVHVGVDTGKTFHKLVARGPDGRRGKAVRVDVGRAGFEAADRYLTTSFPGAPRERMLVGLEFAGHNGFAFAYFLARRGYRVVSVLPFVTKRLKEVEDNSPRKDDAKDAAQVCALVGQGLFVSFPLLDDTGAELRVLATERRRLAVEATRLKNRLHGALDLAWPEFVGQFAGLEFETPIALLTRWPLPQDLVAAPMRSVHAMVRRTSRNHLKVDRVRRLLESARTTIALDVGAEGRRAEIQRLLHRWALVREHMAQVEARLAELVERTPAARALTTVPGVSVVCAATIVAEVGDPSWYEAPRQVLKLAGMNLATTRDTGISVRSRPKQTKRGRPALRRQLFLLAGRWCATRGLYHQTYRALKARNGNSKIKAMCAVARKLVPMLLVIMQTGRAFDAATWRANRLAST